MMDAVEEAAPAAVEQGEPISAPGGPEDSQPAAGRTEGSEERPAEGAAARFLPSDMSDESSLLHFKTRKFFVLRVTTFLFDNNFE